MGRIVIPRPKASRRQSTQINRVRKSGYFANGFGPQEMSLISKLTDLAVAGGGQIARAVQISNREDEQAEAQAEYDQGIQANAEERRAAAQGLVDATNIDFGVEEFFAERDKDLPYSLGSEGVARAHLANLPSALRADMPSRPDLVQPRPMQGGALSPGVLARPGVLAPEDLRPPVQPVSRYAPSWPEQNRPTPALTSGPPLPPQSRPALGEVFGPSAAPALTMEGVLAEAAKAGFDPSKPINPLVREALARASGTMREVPSIPAANLQFQRPFSAADEYGSMQRRAAREQEMQGRDFRQEAVSGLRDPNDPTIGSVGPAPEAKPFRISDILAQASSARTAEQRAMLLQAAADSPDIQAANLSDLAKGAYRDRAMQAVMKLFPKEDKEMSKLDRARYDQITARTDLVDLQRKNLEQKMGDVSKAKSISPAVRRSRSPEINDSFDSAVAWTEHSEDRDAKQGQFSDDAIFVELTAAAEARAAQEGRQPTRQEMAFNAADIDRGRKAKFKRLVGRYSDATPDTILGLVARDMPGRRQKSLRKTVLEMVGNVGDRKKALVSAETKNDSAEVRSDLIQNRQLIVGAARSEDKTKAAETAQAYKKEIIGIKDKNTQRNIAVKHSNTLTQLSKRIELTEDMRSRLAAEKARVRRDLETLKGSIRMKSLERRLEHQGKKISPQEVSLLTQKARYEAAKTAATDPVATAYYNTYLQGLEDVLAQVRVASTAVKTTNNNKVFDATVPLAD